MGIIKFLDENVEKFVLISSMALMSIFVILQVTMRYVFQSSLTWSEEFIRWVFVWSIWIGISYAFRVKRHVSIPMLVDLFPKKIKLSISLFSNLVMMVFFFTLFIYGMNQVMSPLIMRRAAITLYWPFTEVRVSSLWLYLSMPLGALLSSIRLLQNGLDDIKELKAL